METVHTNIPPSRRAFNESHKELAFGLARATAKTNMVEVCLKLGHSQESIDKAFAYNKEPFDSVSQLIDVIHQIEDDEIDTVGGYVVSLAGRVPQRGEVLSSAGFLDFEVTEADARKVRKLHIRPSAKTSEAAE